MKNKQDKASSLDVRLLDELQAHLVLERAERSERGGIAERERLRLTRLIRALTLARHFSHDGSRREASLAWAPHWWSISRKLIPFLGDAEVAAVVLPARVGIEIAEQLFVMARNCRSIDEYGRIFAEQLIRSAEPHSFREYLEMVRGAVISTHVGVATADDTAKGSPVYLLPTFTVRTASGDKPLSLDKDRLVVHFDGVGEGVSERGLEVLTVLLEARGGWVPGTELARHKGSNERPDTIIKALPSGLRAIIEAKPGTGRRIPVVTSQET